MKKSAKLVTLALLTFASISAYADDVKTADFKQYFEGPSGKLNSTQAILAALKGQEVYKCVSVEAKVSKSGTSIGVRNVKKPHVTKN